ncbi:hypothetical protein POTOM_029189 [Populus tomentosa]|uniref:Uncharacterized protein n=1 Tax=Populus tomentosa TaxID=118781 RepID=A0A8X8CSU5_POPTO|nr:hypothetical protein POTOM_029189 [Populus tomentosa]
MPASFSSPFFFFPLPSSASPSNPNAHFSPSPPSPRHRLIPKSNHRHHRHRLSLYLLSTFTGSSSSSSMPPEVSSSSQVIVNKTFEVPSIVDAKSLVECQLATAAFSFNFMLPCSLHLWQLMGNAAKLLVLSANNGPSVVFFYAIVIQLKEVNGAWSIVKEVIGKVVILCMKCLSTILASYTLKNAMQMIHMLQRLLGVSVCQQFCEIVQLNGYDSTTLARHGPPAIIVMSVEDAHFMSPWNGYDSTTLARHGPPVIIVMSVEDAHFMGPWLCQLMKLWRTHSMKHPQDASLCPQGILVLVECR